MKSLKFFLTSLVTIWILASCASVEKNANTPEGIFNDAKEAAESSRYEYALRKFEEIKNRFPYSNFATESELAIADTFYMQENFADAQLNYQNFRDLHPRHPKIDYVIYRTALSYYMQLPETDDRDLTLSNDAIYHFDELIKKYPSSSYTTEAKIKRDELYRRLMEKELYIADFYYKQEKYESALFRYEIALNKYPGIGLDPRAHFGATLSAKQILDTKKRRLHANILIQKYPNSNEAKKVQAEGLQE